MSVESIAKNILTCSYDGLCIYINILDYYPVGESGIPAWLSQTCDSLAAATTLAAWSGL